MASITFNYTIPFGTNLRVGYRLYGSSGPYTYITGTFPSYADSPYTLAPIPAGLYELELTTICNSCSGANYSDPEIIQASAT